ncbi:hypothetical protein C8J56DRAFT_920187 [Mycena floridula]|nr:hypothetical protein C8J56DRAFT_920187 [Mycena floridula]
MLLDNSCAFASIKSYQDPSLLHSTAMNLQTLPAEILLHICSYLDVPDLASLGQLSLGFAKLTTDPVLHKHRILVIAPSRVHHSLFGQGPQGDALRPTVGELVHRNVLRGLNIERRFRNGEYIYTKRSIDQYEAALIVDRRITTRIIEKQIKFLRQRSSAPEKLLQGLHKSYIYPDVESSSLSISRSLLPAMRALKWAFRKDILSQQLSATGSGDLRNWLDRRGKIVQDVERVRLAISPGVTHLIRLYEELMVQ